MSTLVSPTSENTYVRRDVPAVEVVELTKEFRRKDKRAGRFARRRMPALKNVTFTIERGECVAILGQNGSGKSTLVRLLSTLLINDGGEARIFGYDAFRDTRAIRKLVNRVSVEASFFKKMSAAENLSYAARFYGMGPSQTRTAVPEILEKVGFPAERRRVRRRRSSSIRTAARSPRLRAPARCGRCISRSTPSATGTAKLT